MYYIYMATISFFLTREVFTQKSHFVITRPVQDKVYVAVSLPKAIIEDINLYLTLLSNYFI
jgi:hypothetical protein